MSAIRDERGRFLPGAELPPEHRQAISHAMRQRARRVEAQLATMPQPDKKRCNDDEHQGERWLPIEDFRLMRHKLADGSKRHYRAAKCLSCESRRAKERKREWVERMGREEVKRRNRQSSKRYYESHRAPQYVDPALFLEWACWVKPVYTESEARQIRRYNAGEIEGLELGFIDAIMTRYGAADQFAVFYPPT